MENLRLVTFITFLTLVVLSPQGVFAYKTNVHSQLTMQIAQAYNALSDTDLSSADIKNLTKGSIAEDDGKRPLNHFYDPISGRGLLGVSMPAPAWAVDTLSQANYGWNGLSKRDKLFSDATDYSWDRAVYDYSYGDKARAMQTLGHILHLVQDASVPAHVRNDDHLSNWGWGDINLYEEYTGKVAPSTSVNGIRDFHSLRSIYIDLARFTNKNFLSKDTIFEDYTLPKRKGLRLERSYIDGGSQYFGMGNYGKLLRIKREVDLFSGSFKEEYTLKDKQDKILANYYRVLSQKAAEHGVATIDLFFREVELEKKTLTLKYMNKSRNEVSSIASAITDFSSVKSLFGSSLSAVDTYELNRDDWEGARRVAAIFGMSFPTRPVGESVLADAPKQEVQLLKTKLPKPAPKSLHLQGEATLIKGTPEGNIIITPAQQAQPDYEQMGAALLAMEQLFAKILLQWQQSDKCYGKDMTIFKHATCVDPFEEGGFGFGAGGSGGGFPTPPVVGGGISSFF